MSHLQVEQNGSDPHRLADLQAVGEQREAWWALVVGWQHLNVHGGDGAPEEKEHTAFSSTAAASLVQRKEKKSPNKCYAVSVAERRRLENNPQGWFSTEPKCSCCPTDTSMVTARKCLSSLQWNMSAGSWSLCLLGLV